MRSLELLRLLAAPLALWIQQARAGHVEPSAQSTTGALEVDLVFPSNDSYVAVDRLPIVLAFRNTGPARFMDLSFTVHLESNRHLWNLDLTQRLSADDIAWADPYYSFVAYDALTKDVNGYKDNVHWKLNWSLTHTSCLPERQGDGSAMLPVQVVTNTTLGGSVAFTTTFRNPHPSKLVDELLNKSGRTSAGGIAINITDVVDAPSDDQSTAMFGWGQCAILSGAKAVQGSPDQTVDQPTAESMAALIKKRSCVTGAEGDPGCSTSAAGAPRFVGASVAASGMWAAALGGLACFLF